MKILYVAVEPIYPADTGSRIRDYQLIKAMAAKHQVGVAYLSAEEMPVEKDAPYESAWQIKLPKPLSTLSGLDKLGNLMWAIVHRSFPMTRFFLGAEQQHALQRVMEQFHPEVVVIQSSYILPLAAMLKQRFKVPVVLDAHNIEWQLQRRMADTASSSVIMRWVKRWMAANLRRMESQAEAWVSGIAAVSEMEATWWQKQCPNATVSVVPNGVDVDFFKTNKALPQAPVVAFCGSMSYLPNDEGALWFARHVWPLLQQVVPKIRWLIIGKDPSDKVQALANDYITVTGRVDDVRTYIEQSRLSIVPLLAGGGTRLKILEAMSMGRVVISTTVGAEGITASDGLVLADTPQQMADAIAKMLKSPKLVQLGGANRRRVMADYSWTAIGQRMVDLVEAVR